MLPACVGRIDGRGGDSHAACRGIGRDTERIGKRFSGFDHSVFRKNRFKMDFSDMMQIKVVGIRFWRQQNFNRVRNMSDPGRRMFIGDCDGQRGQRHFARFQRGDIKSGIRLFGISFIFNNDKTRLGNFVLEGKPGISRFYCRCE